MSTEEGRLDLFHEEYLAEWVESNLRHLYEVCADYIPWSDAGPETSSEEDDVNIEDAREGRRYKVTWDDCCVQGSFEAAVKSVNYVPDPPSPEPFLESVTFDNGVTVSGSYGYDLEEA